MIRLYSILTLLLAILPAAVFAQSITSFSPASGNVGTLVTLFGADLNLVSAVAVNGTSGVILEKTNTSMRLLVMPGSTSGPISITGTTSAASPTAFGVTQAALGTAQQGPKLFGTGSFDSANQGASVALSADGNTLAVGGNRDNNYSGATWVFVRSGTGWSQQGGKLYGTGVSGTRTNRGFSVALSADGNTLAVGGDGDYNNMGATWVFVRSGTTWSQQGNKLVGTGTFGSANQGHSVALSADGNTLAVGGDFDNSYTGATWIFTRTGTVWNQQGNKLVGTGAIGPASQGHSVALSADGNTLAVAGDNDNYDFGGSTWVFARNGTSWSQQGAKLVGTGAGGDAAGTRGIAVALSADGNTLAVGGARRNNATGATWVFVRTGASWSQQGPQLIGPTGVASLGYSVALAADGSTLAVSGYSDNNAPGEGTWVFTRSGSNWGPQGTHLFGSGGSAPAHQGNSVALSADGSTLAMGGFHDGYYGATWVFSTASSPLALRSGDIQPARACFFPNPVTEQITITGGAPVGMLSLLDGLGRTLLSLSYRQGQPLNLASLAPGCYWLRLDQGVAHPLFKL